MCSCGVSPIYGHAYSQLNEKKFSMPLDGNSSDGCHGMWDLNPDFEQSKIIIGFTRKRQHERAASANTTQLATFYQR